MVSKELQETVEILEPKLKKLARNLGKTPEAVLESAIVRYQEDQLAALDKIVAHAEASGFETIGDFDEDLKELKAEARRRHLDKK